ncbi:hypothetical protein Trydic_g23400 [Trypoxylus dichotomus]
MEGIDARILRICIPPLADYVTHILNHILLGNRLLLSLFLSTAGEMKDLRPISISRALSQIFERCVNDQLYQFLGWNNILSAYQSGFHPGYSSTTAFYVVDDILQVTDNGDIRILILLDFSRVFDTVHYDILLCTLDSIGCNLSVVAHIESYL